MRSRADRTWRQRYARGNILLPSTCCAKRAHNLTRSLTSTTQGLAALSHALGDAVFVMHMGEWTGSDAAKFASGAPPYAARAEWGWAVESAASLPLGAGGAAFWDSLFANMSRVGLRVFKLDHSQQQAPDMQVCLYVPLHFKRILRTFSTNSANDFDLPPHIY